VSAAAAKSLGVHEPQMRWFEPGEEDEADRYLAVDCERTGRVLASLTERVR